MRKKFYSAVTFAVMCCLSFGAYAQTDITDLKGTASTQHVDCPPREGVTQLFDNSAKTKFITFHNKTWVQYQVAQPYIITKYALTSANGAPFSDPKTWSLQGSSDGITWTTIDEQSNQVFASRNLRREFTFMNTVGYSYFRLNMIAKSGRMLMLAEVELYGVLDIKDITDLPGEVRAQYGGSPAAEGIERVIDNDSSTKFLAFDSASYIKFLHGNPSIVTGYSITSANDEDSRDPLHWIFEGSNDDTTWTVLDTRINENFPERFQRREFAFENSEAFTYYRLNMTNNEGNILQLAEWEIFGTGGGGEIPVPIPPKTWQEHWFDHNQLVSRVYYDDDVAVYYDNEVDRSVIWPFKFLGDVWRYTKSVYGDFGRDPRMYVILHTGKYSGGHPAGYLDAGHDYRNVIDVGPGPFTTFDYNAVAIPVHEVAHIVEGASKGTNGSPAFGVWGDSKWAEIFNYDVYKALGREDFALQWYNEQIVNNDDFPRPNTYWFRDWFFPIYSQYGGAQVLNRYFTILSECFPKVGRSYDGGMNMGEFVHFWSGAAGINLKPLATNAFGWTEEYEMQFINARAEHSCLTYDNPVARFGQPELSFGNTTNADCSIWYSQSTKVISIVEPSSKLLKGAVNIYSSFGNMVMKKDLKNTSNIATIDAANLTPGMYVVVIDANGATTRKRILVQ